MPSKVYESAFYFAVRLKKVSMRSFNVVCILATFLFLFFVHCSPSGDEGPKSASIGKSPDIDGEFMQGNKGKTFYHPIDRAIEAVNINDTRTRAVSLLIRESSIKELGQIEIGKIHVTVDGFLFVDGKKEIYS